MLEPVIRPAVIGFCGRKVGRFSAGGRVGRVPGLVGHPDFSVLSALSHSCFDIDIEPAQGSILLNFENGCYFQNALASYR
ncbi:hypothetical protein CFP56_022015 [Quercus suber]|uniref:Uncharacterized protein n=1 Tax=Quercus suber TaxID=58331 RepID=A0AAW0KBU3_QUESU